MGYSTWGCKKNRKDLATKGQQDSQIIFSLNIHGK